MASQITIPPLGESVTEAVLLRWLKEEGASVKTDEPVCELETDKANVEIPAPASGILKQKIKEGTTVKIGDTIAEVSEGKGTGSAKPVEKKNEPAPSESVEDTRLSPSVRRVVRELQVDPESVQGTGPRGRIVKEDVIGFAGKTAHSPTPSSSTQEVLASLTKTSSSQVQTRTESVVTSVGGVRREPMSKIRKKIAERLVMVKQQTAMLTTFNEIDMANVLELKNRYKEQFQKAHGVSLGLMSFFARACILALKEYPMINAFIEGDDIVYHDYVHLGIAVSTERGLVVPVLRNTERMGFAKVESEIKRTAMAAREGKLSIDELSGGTFTITNGGVFGSLLSTPILNPPQSGILGMHTIQKRPKVVEDKIEIRPMMYVALSYDHRLVDGKDSVSFLVKVKESLEDPARLMLEV